MKETCRIPETINNISPFTALLSPQNAAVHHIEYHMVWPRATFSHGHQGAGVKWALTGSAYDAAGCDDEAFCGIIYPSWICPVICNKDGVNPSLPCISSPLRSVCPLVTPSSCCGILHACGIALDSHATDSFFPYLGTENVKLALSQNISECVLLSSLEPGVDIERYLGGKRALTHAVYSSHWLFVWWQSAPAACQSMMHGPTVPLSHFKQTISQ